MRSKKQEKQKKVYSPNEKPVEFSLNKELRQEAREITSMLRGLIDSQ